MVREGAADEQMIPNLKVDEDETCPARSLGPLMADIMSVWRSATSLQSDVVRTGAIVKERLAMPFDSIERRRRRGSRKRG